MVGFTSEAVWSGLFLWGDLRLYTVNENKTRSWLWLRSWTPYYQIQTLYIENPKDTTRKLLELTSELNKVAGYKINTHKSFAFLHTSNEKSEREIKESISFTIATKRMQYLGINLPKKKKELYTENCKTLMKEIKDDINRWRDISCSWVGRINIVKIIYYQMQSTDSMWSLSNYPWHFSQN